MSRGSTMVEALNRALGEEMERDEAVTLLGEDVGVDGGVFRVSDGLLDRFGERRVIDTPLAESVIVGAAVGMAAGGLRPVCEIQFSGFAYQAFAQIESHMARLRWRTRGGKSCPMVLRMPYGAGVRALEHHSESREVYYAHTPGLKVVIPSGPRNARALLASAIRDPDPVIFLEPKRLYRSHREELQEEPATMEIGRALVRREGADLTIITHGAMVPDTLEAAEVLEEEDGVEATVIDLLTLSPLDVETLTESVRETGRAVVVHEAPRRYGPAAEVVTSLIEGAFYYLEAPVERITGYDTIVPYFARERTYLPDRDRILAGARRVMEREV